MLGFFEFTSYSEALQFVEFELQETHQVHDCFWSGERALVIVSGDDTKNLKSEKASAQLILNKSLPLLNVIAGGGLSSPKEEILVFETTSWLDLIKSLDLALQSSLGVVDFRLVRGSSQAKSILVLTGENLNETSLYQDLHKFGNCAHISKISQRLRRQIDFSIES
jgi:hypothetical protein